MITWILSVLTLYLFVLQAFKEYIQKLEKIMERKAQCVHSMRAQLQPYLMPSHSSQSHNHWEHNNDSVIWIYKFYKREHLPIKKWHLYKVLLLMNCQYKFNNTKYSMVKILYWYVFLHIFKCLTFQEVIYYWCMWH